MKTIDDVIRELWARGISIEEISNTYVRFDKEMEDHYKLEEAREALAEAMIEYIKCLNPGSKLTKEDAIKDIKVDEAKMKPKKKEVKEDNDAVRDWLKNNDLLF